MKNQRHEAIIPPNPAEVEYKHARLLMNAQEMAYPVKYKDKIYAIQEFQRCQDPQGAGLKTYVYLFGNPELIPATEITITERPQ